ncbi:MAG: AAA family ATPase [Fervidicoccaceae archaeon]
MAEAEKYSQRRREEARTIKVHGLRRMSVSPIKLEKLVLENFYSYGRKTEISFSDGVTVIVGENGAGKSSIVRGIYFALLGELPDARISDAVHRGKEELYVSLILTDGKNRYRVERSRGRKRSDVLYVYVGDKERIVATRAEDVTKILSRIVLSSDLESIAERGVKRALIDLIILNQGKLDEIGEILSSGRVDKIEFLLNILGLNAYLKAWEKMKDLTVRVPLPDKPLPPEIGGPEKDRYKVTEDDLKEAEERLKRSLESIESIKKEEEKVISRISVLAEREKELSMKKALLEEDKGRIALELGNIESQLSKAKEALDRLRALERQIAEMRKREEELERQLGEVENLKKMLEDLKLREKLSSYVELERELRSFVERTKGVKTKTLGLGITGLLEEVDVPLRKELESIDAKLRSLEGERAVKTREMEEAQKLKLEIEKKEGEFIAEISRVAKILGLPISNSDPLRTFEELYVSISNMLKEKRNVLASLKSEQSRLKRSIEELRDAKGKCPVCGRELDEEHRNKLLLEYGQRLEQINDEAARVESELEMLEKENLTMNKLRSKTGEIDVLRGKMSKISAQEDVDVLKKIEADISELKKKKEAISELLRDVSGAYASKRAILEKIQQIAEMTIDSKDVTAENLEALEGIVEKISKEIELLTSVSKIGLPEDVVEVRKKILALEKKLRDLQPEAKSAELVGIREKRKSLEEQEKELREEASKLKMLEEKRASLKASIDKVSAELSEVEAKLLSVRDELGSLRSRKGILEERKEYLDSLSKSLSEAVYELKVLLKVRSLYERETGLPSVLMRHAVRELKRELVESYRKFELSYDDLNIDDSFNISLINSLQNFEISLDQASGGERVAVYLSFIFAAQKVISELYGGGGRAGFLVLDEPTNYLDDMRVRYLADVLRDAVSAGGGAQIIVVTHEESLKDAGDVVLRVRKSGAVSLVEEEKEVAIA